METNKIKWKEFDDEKAKLIIRNQVVAELCKLEGRKTARRNKQVKDEKDRIKKQRKQEEMDN